MLEIPPLPATTILLVEVGSTAHGTGIPGGEDHDELGVVVETPLDLFGLDERGFRTVMQRTQPEGERSGPGDTDRTLYSLRKFVRLAASGNPSIMMSMWAPVLRTTPFGDELRNLGGAFVGRHVIPRYRGYMQSQAMRLLGTRGGGHGRRGEVPFDEWWHRTLDLDAQLERAESDGSLPDGPDGARIEAWSVATHQAVWAATG